MLNQARFTSHFACPCYIYLKAFLMSPLSTASQIACVSYCWLKRDKQGQQEMVNSIRKMFPLPKQLVIF